MRCTVTGDPGAEVVFRYGEQLAPDGSVRCDNVHAAGEAQVGRLVLAGSAPPTWEPKFGYEGFRYLSARVTGRASVTDVSAVRLQATVDAVGQFAQQL